MITVRFRFHSMITLLTLIGTPTLSWAEGVGSSGGGFSVVCRNENLTIRSAEVLDLYEATLRGETQTESRDDLYQDYVTGIVAYRHYGGDPRKIDRSVKEHYKQLLKTLHFVKNTEEMPKTGDAGMTPKLPSGCGLEQAAVYLDNSNKIILNQEVWDALSTLDQAALLQHEVIYRMLRFAGEKDSRETRYIVGKLYSKTLGQGLPNLDTGHFVRCFAGEQLHSTSIYVVPNKSGGSKVLIPEINGRKTLIPVVLDLKTPLRFSELQFDYIDRYTVTNPKANQNVKTTLSGLYQDWSMSIVYQYQKSFALDVFRPDGSLMDHIVFRFCSEN